MNNVEIAARLAVLERTVRMLARKLSGADTQGLIFLLEEQTVGSPPEEFVVGEMKELLLGGSETASKALLVSEDRLARKQQIFGPDAS